MMLLLYHTGLSFHPLVQAVDWGVTGQNLPQHLAEETAPVGEGTTPILMQLSLAPTRTTLPEVVKSGGRSGWVRYQHCPLQRWMEVVCALRGTPRANVT